MSQATPTALTSRWAKAGVFLAFLILGGFTGWGVAAILYPRPDFASEVGTEQFWLRARQDEEARDARRMGRELGMGIAALGVIVTYAVAEFRRQRRQLLAASTSGVGGRAGGGACLACGKPISPEASKCAACGWSWGQAEAGGAEPGAAADGRS